MDFVELFKKLAKKLKPGIRKLVRLLVVLLVFVAVVVAGIYFLTRVRKISYVGDASYTSDEIKAKCGAYVGKNIFLVDLKAMTDDLEKSLPYLNNVEVSRKLPWTIEVDGDQSLKTYAVVVSKGSYAITNNNVKVLENTNQITNNLIYVMRNDGFWTYSVGEQISFIAEDENDKAADRVDGIQEFLSQLPDAMAETGLRDIGMVLVDSATDISMVYQNRILIRMGDSSNIKGKIKIAMKVISQEDEMSTSQCGILNVSSGKKGVFSPADYDDIPEIGQLVAIQEEQQALADLIEKQQMGINDQPKGEPVTGENGEPVTDENGEPVTEIKEETETTTQASEDVTSESLVTTTGVSA